MSLRLFADDYSLRSDFKHLPHHIIRVRTTRLPKDFFESTKSVAKTRSSSTSASVEI